MEMMNRAIEDASDFMDMKRKLMQVRDGQMLEKMEAMQRGRHELLDDMRKMEIAPTVPPKRHDENRQQYRARVHGKAG